MTSSRQEASHDPATYPSSPPTGREDPAEPVGIAFGLAGLAGAWRAAGPLLGVSRAVPGAIDLVAASVWLVLVLGYGAQGLRQVLADLRDPVLAPFVPVAPITAMILSAALAAYAPGAGRMLVIVSLVVTIAAGGATNVIASALGGYTVLMALVQLRFLPRYTRLKFSPGFWAFTFAYAAAVTDALDWITLKRPPAAAAWAITLLAAITILISAIAARTVIAARRGQLVPASPPVAGSVSQERQAQPLPEPVRA